MAVEPAPGDVLGRLREGSDGRGGRREPRASPPPLPLWPRTGVRTSTYRRPARTNSAWEGASASPSQRTPEGILIEGSLVDWARTFPFLSRTAQNEKSGSVPQLSAI